MAASIRQSWTLSWAETRLFYLTAAGCAAGSRLVAVAALWSSNSDTALPDAVSSVPSLGWNQDAAGVYAPVGGPNQGQNVAIWSAEVTASGDYDILAGAPTSSWGHLVLLEVAGLATGAALDRTASAGASDTSDLTPTAGPTATLSQTNEFVLAVLGATSGVSTADINAALAPGWTRAFYEGDGTTLSAAAVDWRSVSSTAAVTANWGTIAAHAQAWASALATYREAGGVPAGPPVTVSGALVTLGAVTVMPGTVSLGAVNLPPPVEPEPEPATDTVRPQRALHLRGLRGASSAKLLGAAPPNAVPPSTALEPFYAGAAEIFYDDFPGSSLDRQKWGEVLSGSGGNFVLDPAGISVSNGLTIRTWWDGTTWRSGGIRQGTSTQNVGGFTYGQVSVMARVGTGKGYGPVFALWPTASGGAWTSEIDLLQSPAIGKQSGWNRVRGNPPATVQDGAEFSADLTQWHVHTARWETGRTIFYVDGTEIRTVTSITPSQAMAVLLQGYVAAAGDPFYGDVPNDFSDKLIEVAYVRVSQIPGGPQPEPQNPRIVSIEPAGPGALVESVFGEGVVKSFTITTQGITAIDCVVVQNNASFSWRPGLQTVQTTGTATVSARFFAAGDFLKVLRNNDYSIYKDSTGVSAFTPGNNPNPNPNPNPPPGAFFEDFNGSGTGQMQHRWGDTGQISVSNGVVRLGGSFNGVGVMSSVPNDANGGFGNGLFEYRARLNGPNIGDNSGPALVLWPANDYWTAQTVRNNGGSFPDNLSREVDVGELGYNGEIYMASHYTDCSWGRSECDAFVLYFGPSDHDRSQFHTYAVRLETAKSTFMIDGAVIGVETAHPSPDTQHGGVNHVIGFMNRSSNTSLEIDWVRWTPESGTTTQPPADPQPGTAPLRGILRGQSNAILMDYYNGMDHAGARYTALTGRSLSIYYNRFDPPGRTMFSGTAFINQWIPNGWEAEIQRVNEYLSSAQRQAPFVILWMHNESDQTNGHSQAEWVNLVRQSCNSYRANIGRSAAEARVIFIKVKYPYGNPATIFAGFDEMAADSSFNAMVTNIAYNQAMTGGPEGDGGAAGGPPGTSHLSEAEARDTGDKLGDLLASLYPGG